MVKKTLLSLLLIIPAVLTAQDFAERYNSFKEGVHEEYYSFRDKCNREYAEFLRKSWKAFGAEVPVAVPEEENPVPPRPYIPEEEEPEPVPIAVVPIEVPPVEPTPQPLPVEPIPEEPVEEPDILNVRFYGLTVPVRMSSEFKTIMDGPLSENTVADGWIMLSADGFNNTIRDCLETRIRYNLSDWAYLQFLKNLTEQFCKDENDAALLCAYLFSQSGYQMRLAEANGKLAMLYGSEHFIFDKPYFAVDGNIFYPLEADITSVRLSDVPFMGERPLSLYIGGEQLLGDELSQSRETNSKRYPEMRVQSRVPVELIEFYNSYPTSMYGKNIMTRWAMYAETPLAQSSKDILYPSLLKSIDTADKLGSANKILNWIQTGLVYEYDDKVWGGDRAFFAEETLYYPYCDCEDRSILFSRLVRDLLGLDVALVYYPGHLATAVKFDEEVNGDYLLINGQKFTVCDPTYIGAPVGKQMPDLEYDKTEYILLNK